MSFFGYIYVISLLVGLSAAADLDVFNTVVYPALKGIVGPSSFVCTGNPSQFNCAQGNSVIDEITLSGGSLSGYIPTEIGLLLSLKKLHLSNNALTGTIPTQISNLAHLLSLKLDGNQLCGDIPTFPASLPMTTAACDLFDAVADSNCFTCTAVDAIDNAQGCDVVGQSCACQSPCKPTTTVAPTTTTSTTTTVATTTSLVVTTTTATGAETSADATSVGGTGAQTSAGTGTQTGTVVTTTVDDTKANTATDVTTVASGTTMSGPPTTSGTSSSSGGNTDAVNEEDDFPLVPIAVGIPLALLCIIVLLLLFCLLSRKKRRRRRNEGGGDPSGAANSVRMRGASQQRVQRGAHDSGGTPLPSSYTPPPSPGSAPSGGMVQRVRRTQSRRASKRASQRLNKLGGVNSLGGVGMIGNGSSMSSNRSDHATLASSVPRSNYTALPVKPQAEGDYAFGSMTPGVVAPDAELYTTIAHSDNASDAQVSSTYGFMPRNSRAAAATLVENTDGIQYSALPNAALPNEETYDVQYSALP